MEKWLNLQYFSEQPIEAVHSFSNKMMRRLTERNESLKAQRVMEWLYQRNMIFDSMDLESSKIVPMSKKQRERYTRKTISGELLLIKLPKKAFRNFISIVNLYLRRAH